MTGVFRVVLWFVISDRSWRSWWQLPITGDTKHSTQHINMYARSAETLMLTLPQYLHPWEWMFICPCHTYSFSMYIAAFQMLSYVQHLMVHHKLCFSTCSWNADTWFVLPNHYSFVILISNQVNITLYIIKLSWYRFCTSGQCEYSGLLLKGQSVCRFPCHGYCLCHCIAYPM